jgi:hypothetical protein
MKWPMLGPLPTFFINLIYIKSLFLSSNDFQDMIPSEYCSLDETTDLNIAYNPDIACYESCEDGLIPSYTSYYPLCSPSFQPTLQPTNTRDGAVSKNYYDEIIIGFFIVSIFGVMYYLKKIESREELKRVKSYHDLDLPIHKAIHYNDAINQDFIQEHLAKSREIDFYGENAIDLIFRMGSKSSITATSLFALINDSLPLDDIDSEIIYKYDEYHYSWSKLVEKEDQRSVQVVEMILKNHKTCIKKLVHSKTQRGKTCLDYSSERCSKILKKYLYLHQMMMIVMMMMIM